MSASMLMKELQQQCEKASRSCELDTSRGVVAFGAQISHVDVLKSASATRARVKSGASK